MDEPVTAASRSETWPALPLEAWNETYATLHMWTQIVGKIRLAQTPWLNHSWHVTLYVTTRGLTTSPVPYGSRTFEIDFDFVDHQLRVRTSDGQATRVPLEPQSVAAFYTKLMEELSKLDLSVKIYGKPMKLLNRFASTRTRLTARTMGSTPIGSGGSSCKLTGCSKNFGLDLSGSAVRCTFSGVPPTWPSLGFRDEAPQNIPAAFQTCRTG